MRYLPLSLVYAMLVAGAPRVSDGAIVFAAALMGEFYVAVVLAQLLNDRINDRICHE